GVQSQATPLRENGPSHPPHRDRELEFRATAAGVPCLVRGCFPGRCPSPGGDNRRQCVGRSLSGRIDLCCAAHRDPKCGEPALGGFDERFFVYYEDMDFAVRARKLGWSSVFLSTAQAFHRGQGTTDAATARRMFYFARSRILYCRKHFGEFGALAVIFSTLLL